MMRTTPFIAALLLAVAAPFAQACTCSCSDPVPSCPDDGSSSSSGGSTPPPSTATECTPSATIICKGDITGYMSEQAVKLNANTIHVWRLPSYSGKSGGMFSIIQGEAVKAASMSTSPTYVYSTNANCNKLAGSANFIIGPTGSSTFNDCEFPVGATVFVAIKPDVAGQSASYDYNTVEGY